MIDDVLGNWALFLGWTFCLVYVTGIGVASAFRGQIERAEQARHQADLRCAWAEGRLSQAEELLEEARWWVGADDDGGELVREIYVNLN